MLSSPSNRPLRLEVQGLTSLYDSLPILNDVSIHLNEGEFVSIVGPSGCGKSTLFHHISGIMAPEQGRILIDAEDRTGRAGRVSYMYQKDLLMPWKKVVDNVALPLRLKGVGKQESREKALELFELFGLEGFEKAYPYQLSGGMRQRASLLRTYLCNNDILLLDEPFGGLDAITRARLQDWLLELLARLDVSVLFITHDIEEALYLSDRIYVLSDRPATVCREFELHFDRPRERSLMADREFAKLKLEIYQLLT